MSLNQDLLALAKKDKENGIKALFKNGPLRASDYSTQLDELFIDFSKTHITSDLIEAYGRLAQQIGFTDKREALFSGAKINNTEQRSVLHTLLRNPDNFALTMHSESDRQQAVKAKEKFVNQVEEISKLIDGRSKPIKNIVHIGIGGSALGPQMIYEALTGCQPDIKVHFVSNVDAHQLVDVLSQCQVDDTLVVGVSKTFTTIETLTNLETVLNWFKAQGYTDYQSQFFAVTAQPENAIKFGVSEDAIVTFPEWVGGRYSVWSSVSLSVAIVLGMEKFNEFLEGAAILDKHFYETPYESNICFLAAMLDHYYGNYFEAATRATFAYDFRLRSLVDYLQQLETESNGKDRDLEGNPVQNKTSAVVWGGVGTDVQHSVFQLLHQGTQFIPAEFILIKTPDHKHVEHHNQLLANGVAQSAALLAGQSYDEVRQLNEGGGLSDVTIKSKIFSGEKPSTTILLESLTPKSLGMLVAFYEHRTFCNGVLTNINSYDQMGVELGKRLAKAVQPALESNDDDILEQFDHSTAALLKKLR